MATVITPTTTACQHTSTQCWCSHTIHG